MKKQSAEIRESMALGGTKKSKRILNETITIWIRLNQVSIFWNDLAFHCAMAHNRLTFVFTGQIFKFYILMCDLKFYIAVNNSEFCTYDYRMPVDLIRTVQLKYDLQFVTQVDHRSTFPTPHPPVQFDDARNIFSNDVPQPFKSGEHFEWKFRIRTHRTAKTLSLYFRSCDGDNWNTVWQSEGLVPHSIYRSSLKAPSATL